MKIIKLFIILAGLSFGTVYSQSINKAKLDSLFSILAEKNKAMGSLAISKNGTVVYTRAIGYSMIADNEKRAATVNTKYRIGSISKMFTATMIFQLIEEGKLTLATTLDKYFPGIPNSKIITVGNLLAHRSGLHNITDDPEYMTYMTKPKTQGEMIDIISKNKVDFQPDEKTTYSNTNFILLGYIVEKITGQTYPQNLEKRITSKIGLKNTYYGKKTSVAENEALSYKFDSSWKLEPETDMSIPGGAGAIVSTPADLTKFIESLFGLKLVSEQSLAQMKTIKNGMGMGMFQIPFYTMKGYGHNGGIDGFASNVAFFPEDSLSIAYCTNGMVYPMNSILIGVLSIYYNKDYKIPAFTTVAVKAEDLAKYTGLYSSTQLPLKITISINSGTLTAQATGQPSFPLEATGKDNFKFDQAGVVMEFNPAKNEMTLKQGGGVFLFSKDK
jgi:D-alanyl-D-alanine carboxypeptidase